MLSMHSIDGHPKPRGSYQYLSCGTAHAPGFSIEFGGPSVLSAALLARASVFQHYVFWEERENCDLSWVVH